jgi:prepilin-type N-terminal cleavage/methylation domain-containing protein
MPNLRKSRRTRAQHGFSLLELAAAVAVVAILAGALLDRILYYQEQAEKVAMEQTVGIIRSALHLQFANLVAKGHSKDIPALAEQNPMNWLAEKPKNYAGEFYSIPSEDVVLGHWYFDARQKNLIYFAGRNVHLRTREGEGSQIRFGVKLITSNNISEHNKTTIEGVILDPVVPYTWF